ncbi:unnamed protein product [Hymenolepis diminuta]|uniref:Phosphatidylinositol 3-kinase catalytic subunit type 3 n=1 Tax=Hymenolepis diminuta TaxID=6216 RepID=A0A564ZDH7_HYMDI|nr:unnamed protein product [Hymenolepis diminuta]
MDLNIIYLRSCDLPKIYKGKSLIPHMIIKSLSAFKAENFKKIKGRYDSLACYGELRLAYCITRILPMFRMRRVGAWTYTNFTKSNQTDPIVFGDGVDMPFPYSWLYHYSGICLVLLSSYTDSKGVHDQYIAGCHIFFYNSKRTFRNGDYDFVMHPLDAYDVQDLDSALNCVIDNNLIAKPKSIPELNNLLKTNRKLMRGEFLETPLDQQSLAVAMHRIDQLKLASKQMFLSVKFIFSTAYPFLRVPVVFQRSETGDLAYVEMSKKWNPYDEMYFKMTRTVSSAYEDRKKIPNQEIKDRLKAILDLSFTDRLTPADSDVIWKYRFYLSNKHPEEALSKFIVAVQWDFGEQRKQAIELLKVWPRLSSAERILELLTQPFSDLPVCRLYAVSRLQDASDEDIELYLYQLVQALHYENTEAILKSDLAIVDEQEAQTSNMENESAGSSRLSLYGQMGQLDLNPDANECPWKMNLAEFLIQRGRSNFRLANYLYWFLKLEVHEDTPNTPAMKNVFNHVLSRFMASLTGSETLLGWYADLLNQTTFVDGLYDLMKQVIETNGKRTAKIEILQRKLAEQGPALTNFDRPLPFPLDPSFLIAEIDAKSATLFKSTTQPALLKLISTTGEIYQVIFKTGDDLRQDQLVLQMLRLMDVILKKESFDLHLTPYRVLPASCRHGFIEFVRGVPIAEVSRQEGSITKYLQNCNRSPTIPMHVLETYMRSCAGYCVITYLLGVGDRHLENILLTEEGKLFHIDFSFIFGNDPKMMAPNVRLTKDMIETMGGTKTELFKNFLNSGYTAFLNLRGHANVFMALLSLVQDAGIGDIARDPQKSFDFLKERFLLDRPGEEASQRFCKRVLDGIGSVMPEVIEKIHLLMQGVAFLLKPFKGVSVY